MPGSATNSAEQMLYGTLLTLTFVSGLIDAASFIALGHVFTANVTENVVFMAFALAGIPELSLRSLVALLTALAGAVLAGHLDSRIRWEKRTSWLSIALVIEAAVLAIAVFVGWSGRTHLAKQSIVLVVIALTCSACGGFLLRRLRRSEAFLGVRECCVANKKWRAASRWHFRKLKS